MTAIGGAPAAANVALRVLIGYPVDAGFRIEDNGDGVDLTDATAVAQVRRTANAPTTLLDLDVDIVLPQTGDDKGRFRLTADQADTEELHAVVGVWDVRFDLEDGAHRWMGGDALIEQPVSRNETS